MSINENDNNVTLSVRDNGHGVAVDKQQHIFKRFYSSATESSKEVGGTGVGLYLSKSIISLHGGDIWFESAEGEGTTFHFSLPKDEATRRATNSVNSDDIYYVPSMGSSSSMSTLERESIVDGTEDGERLPCLLLMTISTCYSYYVRYSRAIIELSAPRMELMDWRATMRCPTSSSPML